MKAYKVVELLAAAIAAIALIAIGVGIFAYHQSENKAAPQTPNQVVNQTNRGSNSPAASLSASASGNSTVNQAGRDLTISNGISKSTMLALLKEKSIAANAELAAKYPKGYALLGVANGSLVFFPNLQGVEITTDWNKVRVFEKDGRYMVGLSETSIKRPDSPDILVYKNLRLEFPRVNNRPTLNPYFADFYLETIDAEKGIFLIGFK